MNTAATDTRTDTIQQIERLGAVAVVRLTDAERGMQIVEAIHKGGVSAIEITMTVPNALEMIGQVAREMADEVIIGVGSVTDREGARRAIEAGARYVVAPIFKPEIVEEAHRHGAPAMPGAFSPTEIQLAHEAGADVIKVFPADIVGMKFFKAVLAPLPHLKLMPTGGVSLTNAGDWLRHGAVAVGVGSALLDKKAIAEGDYARLTENARTLVQSIAEARAEA